MTREEILKHTRKTVLGLYTGIEFTIRKIDPFEWMEPLGVLPAEPMEPIADRLEQLEMTKKRLKQIEDNVRKKTQDDPSLNQRIKEFYLEKGVVKPKIWFGSDATCPPDEICVDDLGADGRILVTEISQFSATLAGLERFLPRAGAGDPGPGGETVREAPIGADPEEDAPAAGEARV